MRNTRLAIVALVVAIKLDARHHAGQIASLFRQARAWATSRPARVRVALAAELSAISRRLQAWAVRLDPSLAPAAVTEPAPATPPPLALATIDAEPRRAYAAAPAPALLKFALRGADDLVVARCRLAPVARLKDRRPTPLLPDRRVPATFTVDQVVEAVHENPWRTTREEVLAKAEALGLAQEVLIEQGMGRSVAQVAFAAKDAEVLMEMIEDAKRAAARPGRARPKATGKRAKTAGPDREAKIAAAVAAVVGGASVRIAAKQHGVAESTLRRRLKVATGRVAAA